MRYRILDEARGREHQGVAQISVVVGVLRRRHTTHVDSVNTLSKVHIEIPAELEGRYLPIGDGLQVPTVPPRAACAP